MVMVVVGNPFGGMLVVGAVGSFGCMDFEEMVAS